MLLFIASGVKSSCFQICGVLVAAAVEPHCEQNSPAPVSCLILFPGSPTGQGKPAVTPGPVCVTCALHDIRWGVYNCFEKSLKLLFLFLQWTISMCFLSVLLLHFKPWINYSNILMGTKAPPLQYLWSHRCTSVDVSIDGKCSLISKCWFLNSGTSAQNYVLQ